VPRVTFTVESSAPPERVLAAATDFSDRRPELWPNSSRKYFKVHERGEDWAEVTEGTDRGGGFWERVRYDWSTPGVVRATVLESNVFTAGTWELRADPSPSGGSVVTVVNDRRTKGKGRLFAVGMALIGKRFFTRLLRQTLDRVEQEPAGR
jgi:hypothetical protein